MEKTRKILIVDGHGLAFRAFYAVPPLSAQDGTPTNAITGFMNMLARVEEDLSSGCCAVVFDAPGPTFWHEAFPQYKEQRRPTPEDAFTAEMCTCPSRPCFMSTPGAFRTWPPAAPFNPF